MSVLVWNQNESEANELLRGLMRQAKYPWVYRKLNAARFHIIETHSDVIPDDAWTDQNIVTNWHASEPEPFAVLTSGAVQPRKVSSR